MDLARLAETTRSTQRIEDQYLALRQGRSDRLDTWLRIRWQRVEALGERRLGRSVEIDDVATRGDVCPPAAGQAIGQRLACEEGVTQGFDRSKLAIGDPASGEGGHSMHQRDARSAQPFDHAIREDIATVGDNEGRPACERHEHIAQHDVERQASELSSAIARTNVERLSLPCDEVRQAGMHAQHPLRHTGRSRGEEDVGRSVASWKV